MEDRNYAAFMKPQSPIAIANYFIELAHKQGKPLSPMKLQKLVFFAHGWWLALTDRPLINETVEAWEYGPVIRDVYNAFKHYGKNNITEPYCSTDIEGLRSVSHPPERPCADPDVLALLNKVWDVYSGFSAIQLSNMTHLAGTPWEKQYTESMKSLGYLPRGLDIPDDTIKDYFKSLAGKAKDSQQ